MKKTSVQRPCVQCGRTMTVKVCLLERKKFCSRVCLGRSKVAHMNAVRRPMTANAGWFTKGSTAGAANAKWVPPVTLICEECGAPFSLKPWMLRHREKHNGRVRFCSRPCSFTHRRKEMGPRSHNWSGGGRLLDGRLWQARRRAVIALQGGYCARCRTHIGRPLQVHHIEGRQEGQDPYQAHRDENLLGVCNPCHGRITKDNPPPALQQEWRTALLSWLSEHHPPNPSL